MTRFTSVLLPQLLLLVVVGTSKAFQPNAPPRQTPLLFPWTAARAHHATTTTRSSSSSALHSLPTAVAARDTLLETAERLKKLDGVLLVDSNSKKALEDAAKNLEAVSSSSSFTEQALLGDWTLLCSTATNTAGLDLSKVPFLNVGPLKSISDLLKRSLVVKQRIRCMQQQDDADASNDDDNKKAVAVVDRIDHVLEYQPPDTLKELLGDIPEALQNVNLNPLHVTEGKLTLVHKAKMEQLEPTPVTKLSLESIVFSVAGTSQYLDGSGADLLGINLPFGEFLNSGTFETTYMDDEIRISRGKLGMVDQLRVFVRSEKQEQIEAEEEEEQTKAEKEEEIKDAVVVTEAEVEKDESSSVDEEEDSGPPEESGDI